LKNNWGRRKIIFLKVAHVSNVADVAKVAFLEVA